MAKTNEIAVYEKKIIPLVETAKSFEIKVQDDMLVATELLSKMNVIVDKVTEESEKVTKPLNAALKAERARWSPVKKLYEVGIETIRTKMSQYQTEQVRLQKVEADKIANRVAKGSLRIETGVKKLEELQVPEKEVATTAGLVQFAEQKVLKLTDVNLIPDKFYTLNEKAVLDALKAGEVVPGAEIQIIQVPRNYR